LLTSAAWAQGADPRVKLTTSMGDIVVQLDPAKAPKTVANFLQYVKDKHYDGTVFHRVIDGFMVQGGGFTADMKQKPAHEPIANEADNGLRNRRGTIAMARTNDLHSATSQFFVNLVDNAFLDHRPGNFGYAVFGRVASGIDVIDKIAATKTGRVGGHGDVPQEPVVVTLVRRASAA
jgi:cyclophilin family peptidyl-prolyl cis-trans isomerase